ncbi:MAG: polynucleotide adenylyltransferase PcnB [Gammaproteobacteria bacterium]|nr:polynucleotide adenylyltransferase PcnB [Gammaproteobacteria bacterium]
MNKVIVPRSEHTVSRKQISKNALKVLYRLNENGFSAYLVGGGVRDALVGLSPKDFDVATDASPEDVKELFKNSRIIGRRFRLVHVLFGREVIEVATFRAGHDKGAGGEVGEGGRIVRDNVYGTLEEDAVRRDFSVNALYYNIDDFSVVDFMGGLEDIHNGVFRLIGDPILRCEEDPVRVLRAARLAAKLDFTIEEKTLAAMQATAPLLSNVPPARLFEEVLKLFQGGYAMDSFDALDEHDLLKYLFPTVATRLDSHDGELMLTMLDEALENTDDRVAAGKPITPSYLLAFLLWFDVEEAALTLIDDGVPSPAALHQASDDVVQSQIQYVSIPRRFSGVMKDIWTMQLRLEQWQGTRALSLLNNRPFRAAYDFLCLRSGITPVLKPVADWWTDVQTMSPDEQRDFAEEKPVVYDIWGEPPKRRKRKRKPTRARNNRGNPPGSGNAL